jgi:hypothetical protein
MEQQINEQFSSAGFLAGFSLVFGVYFTCKIYDYCVRKINTPITVSRGGRMKYFETSKKKNIIDSTDTLLIRISGNNVASSINNSLKTDDYQLNMRQFNHINKILLQIGSKLKVDFNIKTVFIYGTDILLVFPPHHNKIIGTTEKFLTLLTSYVSSKYTELMKLSGIETKLNFSGISMVFNEEENYEILNYLLQVKSQNCFCGLHDKLVAKYRNKLIKNKRREYNDDKNKKIINGVIIEEEDDVEELKRINMFIKSKVINYIEKNSTFDDDIENRLDIIRNGVFVSSYFNNEYIIVENMSKFTESLYNYLLNGITIEGNIIVDINGNEIEDELDSDDECED